jgi:hypothetical protein
MALRWNEREYNALASREQRLPEPKKQRTKEVMNPNTVTVLVAAAAFIILKQSMPDLKL